MAVIYFYCVLLIGGFDTYFKKWIAAIYQNHQSREHNTNGLQPYTKTIDPVNAIKMDYSHVPKPSIQ
jgi:hypothetical protein